MKVPLQIIIQGCRQQDIHYQEMMYRYFYPGMIKICMRYAADADGAGIIYNNAMLRIFKNITTYAEEGKLEGWIKTIVVNCCIDFCKKKNIFKNIVSNLPEEEITIDPEVFDRVSYKEIQQVITTLPATTATVFRLFIYEGLTHKQISEHLNISEGTSKWHVSEAKKILKKKLAKAHENNFILDATR